MLRKIDKSCMAHPDQDRAECAALVDALIEKFQRSGLLDDAGYLRGSVISLRRRGLSARAIEAKLAAKGLSHATIKSALAANAEEAQHDNADFHAALRLARRKRLGPFGRADEKALATLARAGFDYETAQRVLKCSLAEAEEHLHDI
jgi:regulatory protein